jgi:hypothetical protein
MKEQVFVAPGVDEPKSLFRQPLDRTFSHFVQLPRKCLCGVALTNMVRLLHREFFNCSSPFALQLRVSFEPLLVG